MGDRFGLSDSDLHSLTGWLQSNGFQVDWVAPSRVFIAFSGTAAAVNNAFQSELHTYRVNDERRLALNSEAHIPAALAPAIRAVRGLFTLQTSPNLIARTESAANPQLTSRESIRIRSMTAPGKPSASWAARAPIWPTTPTSAS
jgi:subtilase family serine protease